MTSPPGLLLPNDIERRKIFYTIKRWSSHTAWARILDFYVAWKKAARDSRRIACEHGWEDRSRLSQVDWVQISEALAQFERGCSRLRQGDKRVFRCDSNGDFRLASEGILSHWIRAYGYISTGDIEGGNEFTPLWDEFISALLALNRALGECSGPIVEPNYQGDPLEVVPLIYGSWIREKLLELPFPVDLPEVPDPPEPTLVRTGRAIPYSGIWEPVGVPRRRLIDVFKLEQPRGPFLLLGCMNYLHGDRRAPKALQDTGDESLEAAVTWRLLWRDDRYADGTVPSEEASYFFLEPPAPDVKSVPGDDLDLVGLNSGQRTPTAGRWLLQDSLTVSIDLPAGATLPLHDGRTVRWVLADRGIGGAG